jgi:hypothetical protein
MWVNCLASYLKKKIILAINLLVRNQSHFSDTGVFGICVFFIGRCVVVVTEDFFFTVKDLAAHAPSLTLLKGFFEVTFVAMKHAGINAYR